MGSWCVCSRGGSGGSVLGAGARLAWGERQNETNGVSHGGQKTFEPARGR
jgi:hypothetical protein